jgi:hypothetical protein
MPLKAHCSAVEPPQKVLLSVLFIDGVASTMIATFHGFAAPKAAVAVADTGTEVMLKTRMNFVGTLAVCFTRTALG